MKNYILTFKGWHNKRGGRKPLIESFYARSEHEAIRRCEKLGGENVEVLKIENLPDPTFRPEEFTALRNPNKTGIPIQKHSRIYSKY